MKRFTGGWLAAIALAGLAAPAQADDKDATPILDKAIAALGGEEKLAKAGTATWKATGTITFNGNDNPIKTTTTVQGVDRLRSEFTGEFNGNEVKGVTVLAADKGWRKFGEDAQDLDADALASEKRRAYLQVVPMTILPLKGKGFKAEAAAEEKSGGKPVAVVKVTGPDGQSFTLSFDKETGLPAKLSAMVKGFGGEDMLQETTFEDYKDFGGVKRATRISTKRDGEPFLKYEVTEYKVVEKLDDDTFAEPK